MVLMAVAKFISSKTTDHPHTHTHTHIHTQHGPLKPNSVNAVRLKNPCYLSPKKMTNVVNSGATNLCGQILNYKNT